MTIYFDMDGTIADLYGVENWLEMLQNYDTFPYENAAVMLNMSLLARYLNKLQKNGYSIGIISWTSKNGTDIYNAEIAYAKLMWLFNHLKSVFWDEIHIVDYGTPKNDFLKNDNDILFDDEEQNRINWTGKAYPPEKIIDILKELARV